MKIELQPTKEATAHPITFFFLNLPCGISGGFITVTMPYLLVQRGFTVAAVASIVALGLSSNIIRFLWSPLIDLTLSLHKWYIINTGLCAVTLMLLSIIPLQPASKGIVALMVFLSQVAATLVVAPVGGMMAKTVPSKRKGRAGGWFQAGNLGGSGLGGGLGLWLSTNASVQLAVVVLSILMAGSCLALFFVPQVVAAKDSSFKEGFKNIYADLKSLAHSPLALYSIALILTPIGIGACYNIWSSVAGDWNVSANEVALVTGTLSGVSVAMGCIMGGWMADKFGRFNVFFLAGVAMALTTLALRFLPATPSNYKMGVLIYAWVMGLNYASYSAIVLHAIGGGLASTKYALVSSFGNVPLVAMTAFVGWLHDARGVQMMLLGESFLGLGFVIIFVLILYFLQQRKIIVPLHPS